MPYICSALGIAFAGATVYTTYKVTIKYVEEVPKETRAKPIKKPADLVEKVKIAAPYYIIPTLLGIATGVSIVSSTVLSANQQKGIASGYIALDKAYSKYRSINRQINGDGIDQEIYQKMVFDSDTNETKKCLKAIRDDTEALMCVKDTYTENFFELSKESFLIGLIESNRMLSSNGYLSLNELYNCMDVPTVPYGNEIGWSIDTFNDFGAPPYLEVGLTKCNIEGEGEFYALYYVYNPLPTFMDGWLN